VNFHIDVLEKTWKLLIQYICLHKEIAVQNALRYNFALLSLARFSEFEGDRKFPSCQYSDKILRR